MLYSGVRLKILNINSGSILRYGFVQKVKNLEF